MYSGTFHLRIENNLNVKLGATIRNEGSNGMGRHQTLLFYDRSAKELSQAIAEGDGRLLRSARNKFTKGLGEKSFMTI
ncbi:hypothetical protein BGY98DRAFT_1179450, partial [Russula aff. rugulosa BPL654]